MEQDPDYQKMMKDQAELNNFDNKQTSFFDIYDQIQSKLGLPAPHAQIPILVAQIMKSLYSHSLITTNKYQ
jgi:hypothetical protein